MLCIIPKLRVKSDMIAGLLATMEKPIAQVCGEPGNEARLFHRVPGRDQAFVCHEQYRDETVLTDRRAHIAGYEIDMNNRGEMLLGSRLNRRWRCLRLLVNDLGVGLPPAAQGLMR